MTAEANRGCHGELLPTTFSCLQGSELCSETFVCVLLFMFKDYKAREQLKYQPFVCVLSSMFKGYKARKQLKYHLFLHILAECHVHIVAVCV